MPNCIPTIGLRTWCRVAGPQPTLTTSHGGDLRISSSWAAIHRYPSAGAQVRTNGRDKMKQMNEQIEQITKSWRDEFEAKLPAVLEETEEKLPEDFVNGALPELT